MGTEYEGRKAAAYLTKACRVAQAKGDTESLGELPSDFAGWLEARHGETLGPDGGRLLVDLLEELSFLARRHLHDQPVRDAYLMYLGDRCVPPKLTEMSHRLGVATRTVRNRLDRAYDLLAVHLDDRPGQNGLHRSLPELAAFESAAGWLNDRRSWITEVQRLAVAWDRELGAGSAKRILFLTALSRAEGRFLVLERTSPIWRLLDENRGSTLFIPNEPCGDACSAAPFGRPADSHCDCWVRAEMLASRPEDLRPLKARELPDAEAAFQVALHQVLTTKAWAILESDEIEWFVATRETRRGTDALTEMQQRASAPGELRELTILFESPESLLRPGTDVDIVPKLHRVAKLIDDEADHDLLRTYTELSSAWVTRAMRVLEVQDPPPGLLHSVASLERSTVGGLRELRSPGAMDLALQSFIGFRTRNSSQFLYWKSIEAFQDVVLANQRQSLWMAAEEWYRSVIHLLEQYPDTQKRFEIEEQLHLGRMGGLTLQAERVIRTPKRLRRGTSPELLADRAMRIHGSLMSAYAHADRLFQTSPGEADSGNSEARSVGEPEELPGVLRFTPNWEYMPKIMLARAYVARALEGSDKDARSNVARAREILNLIETAPIHRHRWEALKVRVVAAVAWDGDDGDDFGVLVEQLVRLGGDDDGDYVIPMLRWAAGPTSPRRMRDRSDDFLEAVDLVAAVQRTPRLPDFSSLGPSAVG